MQNYTIKFTTKAADKVHQLSLRENNPNINLRLSITGGGCSGFQYVFSFSENIDEEDTVIETPCSDKKYSAKLIIDWLSLPYLNNAEIDYEESINGEQFIIHNPQAKTTCGCGSSFSIT